MMENTTTNDMGEISDGYHTFNELYAHRHELFIQLCFFLDLATTPEGNPPRTWKSKFHSDGSFLDGWFIMGIDSRVGKQITYHLPMSYWDRACALERERAPEWDGHTSNDVLQRLKNLQKRKE